MAKSPARLAAATLQALLPFRHHVSYDMQSQCRHRCLVHATRYGLHSFSQSLQHAELQQLSTNIFAALISASQPLCPRLPLPSMRKTMSSVSLHFVTGSATGTMHRFMLHALNCKRSLDHVVAHLPAPSAGIFTNLCRFRVPPSQSLEHHDPLVHAVSSQSFSQDWGLRRQAAREGSGSANRSLNVRLYHSTRI